jgi:DNA-binding NarL/FixJ family response regulator
VTILVVEDEAAVRELIVDVLSRQGYEVTARARAEATVLLAEDGPKLVVCRADVVAEVSAASPSTPVCATAVPVDPAQLAAAVRAALARRPTRVLVVEDHPAVRASLVAYLEAHADVEVVGEAENGWEAYRLARQTEPDFVLMDIRMPVMDGIESTRMIKGRRPETRIVLLSTYEHDELIDAGLEAGAEGFLVKGASGSELIAVVRQEPWAA